MLSGSGDALHLYGSQAKAACICRFADSLLHVWFGTRSAQWCAKVRDLQNSKMEELQAEMWILLKT